MAQREQLLTHENLKGLFKSNFELTQYAIRLGRHYLKSGHEISADALLELVRKNPRAYEDLKIQEKHDEDASES